ncbi:MAG TPA: amidohydrolase family protein, partial [Spirochaetia bacterium]|nr:amidohydrolase family protein [Spirochaetia bacterium]
MTIQGISVFSGRAVEVDFDGASILSAKERKPQPGLPYLAPGFFDLQVNGYRGIDYSSPGLQMEQVARLVTELAASGTTRHLPTIISSPKELILRNLRCLARVRESAPELAQAIPGYHIEGPFISPTDGPRGAHSRSSVRNADYDEFREWQDAAAGRIRIVTLAPEVPGALDLIARLTEEGVIASIGHSASSPEGIREAVRAGARMSTHLGNGSHAQIPRLRNYIWEQLACDDLVAGIITDGYHLPPAVVKTMTRAKGLDRLFLVTDVAV